MKESELKKGLFLLWNCPGGSFFWGFTIEVKVVALDCSSISGIEKCFCVYRIADNAIIDIKYDKLEQFTVIIDDTKIKELTTKLIEISSKEAEEIELQKVRDNFKELREIVLC